MLEYLTMSNLTKHSKDLNEKKVIYKKCSPFLCSYNIYTSTYST